MIDKSILTVAVLAAAALLLPAARAADLPTPYIAPTLPAEFQWSGPYVGDRIGGGGGVEHDNLTPGALPTADSFSLGGGLAGVYAGMNWQQDHYVYGFEGNADFANLSGSHDFSLASGDLTGTMSLTTDWQGSFRGRAGYAVNRTLFYVAAGLAAAHATVHVSGQGLLEPFDVSDTGVHFGPTIAGGVEYAVTDQLMARGEAQFTSFANHTYELGDNFKPTSVRWDQLTATLGLSYKF
ncbi:MAG: outer membrane beta-barrel protein [Devosia sp.]|nr:outer membrane beta-barrel protein [Devosia sp.]